MYTLYICAHAFSWKSFRLNRLLPGEATRMRVSRREARCESRGTVRRCVAIYTDGSYSGENLPDEATRALCTGTHNALHRLPCRIQNTGRALRVTLHTLVNWLLHAPRSFPFSLSLSYSFAIPTSLCVFLSPFVENGNHLLSFARARRNTEGYFSSWWTLRVKDSFFLFFDRTSVCASQLIISAFVRNVVQVSISRIFIVFPVDTSFFLYYSQSGHLALD